MVHIGQLMILLGLLLSAAGGYVVYISSEKDANEKHKEIIEKGNETISEVKTVADTLLTNQKGNLKIVQSKIAHLEKSVGKMKEQKTPKTQITITGNNNRVVAGDNTGINGDVFLNKPERKLNEETLNSIIALNKNKKPYEVIYYTNTEECRSFGVSIINALKEKGFEVTFRARTAMLEINYPADAEANAAYGETETTFIVAIYPLR